VVQITGCRLSLRSSFGWNSQSSELPESAMKTSRLAAVKYCVFGMWAAYKVTPAAELTGWTGA
jgi:hypothetical protein